MSSLFRLTLPIFRGSGLSLTSLGLQADVYHFHWGGVLPSVSAPNPLAEVAVGVLVPELQSLFGSIKAPREDHITGAPQHKRQAYEAYVLRPTL